MNATDPTQLLRQVRDALQTGRYADAAQYLQQAAERARQLGDMAAEARHLGNLALIYYQRLNRPDQALALLERALACARAAGDRLTEDGLRGNLGNILRELGRCEEAIIQLNEALLIAQEEGDARGRGIWLANLGLVYDDLGQTEQAIELHKEAVAVARALRDQRGLAVRLNHLGDSYLAASQPTEALKCFHEAVAVLREIGDLETAARRMNAIGGILSDLGRAAPSDFEANLYFDLALDAYRDALAMARELDDVLAEAEALSSIGSVFGNLGYYDPAIDHFHAAYALFERLGLHDRLPLLLQNIELAIAYRDGAAQ